MSNMNKRVLGPDGKLTSPDRVTKADYENSPVVLKVELQESKALYAEAIRVNEELKAAKDELIKINNDLSSKYSAALKVIDKLEEENKLIASKLEKGNAKK